MSLVLAAELVALVVPLLVIPALLVLLDPLVALALELLVAALVVLVLLSLALAEVAALLLLVALVLASLALLDVLADRPETQPLSVAALTIAPRIIPLPVFAIPIHVEQLTYVITII